MILAFGVPAGDELVDYPASVEPDGDEEKEEGEFHLLVLVRQRQYLACLLV